MISIDGFEIDAFLSVAPTHSAQATRDPVEQGADITDHIILSPMLVTLEGIVSDTPLDPVLRNDFTKPSADAYALLVEIQSSRSLVTIESGVYPAFTEMALLSLSAPKSARTGEALRFVATFQQITIADVAHKDKITLVARPINKKRKRGGAKPSKKAGPVKPHFNEYTVKKDEQGISILNHILDW